MPVTERPNIVLCVFDSLSAAGGGIPETSIELSALPKLYSNGACFNRTYTPCPESSPARASLFTGLDPSVHGLWSNGVTLPEHEQTFAQRLAHAGYSNYLAGRYQLSGVSRWTTEQARRGEFSQMDWAHGPLHRSRQNAYLAWLKKASPKHYSQLFSDQADPNNTELMHQQRDALNALPDSLSFNHWVGQSVGEWIESQSRDQPILAIAGFSVGDRLGTEPHPATDVEHLNEQALQQADGAIGHIMERLQSSNRLHDTVVIVTAARGNIESPGAENVLNEKAIRVPLIVHGEAFTSQTIDSVVSTIDIAPTVLAIANVPCGPRMQGESILGLFDGESTARDWSLSRIRQNLSSGERNWQTALVSRNMKLVVDHGKPPAETTKLFNLETDPLEQNNLAGLDSHAPQVEQLLDQMIDARCALEDRTEPRIAEF